MYTLARTRLIAIARRWSHMPDLEPSCDISKGRGQRAYLAEPSTSRRRASSPASLIADRSSVTSLIGFEVKQCFLIAPTDETASMCKVASNVRLGVLLEAIFIGPLISSASAYRRTWHLPGSSTSSDVERNLLGQSTLTPPSRKH